MKSEIKKFSWVVIIVMLGLFGFTAATIASDIDWPWSSNPGTVLPSLSTQAQSKTTDLEPDNNGYTGLLPEASEEILVPSAEEQDETIDWEAMIPEAAPDQNDVNADPNWSSIEYLNVSGSALRPRNSSVDWSSTGSGGCLYTTAGDPYVIFNLHLNIPNGARIDYLRLYSYDTSTTNNAVAFVTQYDGAGGYNDITFVKSDGAAGYGTTLSPYIGHIVDAQNEAFVLNWRPEEAGETMRLCGLRVAYRLP